MMEFLIRRTDGEWFDLHREQFAEALRPSSFPSKPIEGWGSYRIKVEGIEVSFSCEDPGIQVCFEGDDFPESIAREIVEEICHNVENVTGQFGKVVPL